MSPDYKHTHTMTIVCRYTGIQADITLPTIGRLTLEYTHPLSHIDSALEASNRQDFMRKLDAPVLAGILLTLLRHSKLLAQSKDHAGSLNAQLSKASRGHLIKAIELARRVIVPLPKTHFLPKVTFDHYGSQSEANRAIQSTIGTLVAEVMDDDSAEEEVRNYFKAHTKATSFEGFTRERALQQAKEIDEIKKQQRQAELDRRAEKEAEKAAKERKAKEGMLTKRERAQKLRLIVRTTDHTLSEKQIGVLRRACQQSELLPEAQLLKLQDRVGDLLVDTEDEVTIELLTAAQSIFTHCMKVMKQSNFSIEEELLGEASVHGQAEQKKDNAEQGSLLERIRAKRASTSK